MANLDKDATTQAAAPAAPAAPAVPQQEITDFPLSLHEFCARLSLKDTRVELIAAFHHVESAAGRIKDRAAEFIRRFESFESTPL